jgi:hypothetical protein
LIPENRIRYELSRIIRIGTDDSEYGRLEKVGARRIIHTKRVPSHVMVDDLLVDSETH